MKAAIHHAIHFHTVTRLACWLSRGDNAFGVLVVSMAPLFALIYIGMVGAP